MLKVWQAWVATIAVALLSSTLVTLDLSDGAFRRWWSARAFTTDAIAGILVVLITVLIVNQALGIRQQRERFRATAAHAVTASLQLLVLFQSGEPGPSGAGKTAKHEVPAAFGEKRAGQTN